MGIFDKLSQHEDHKAEESEDLTQYVRESIADVPPDPTGGRLGHEEAIGAEIMGETLAGFEEHLHHPEWHPGSRAPEEG